MARPGTAHTHHTIAIQQVQQLLYGAQARGLDTHALLRRAGIAPALLDAPLSRVTQAQCATLIGVLRHHLRDELWGLCPHPLPPGSFALGCELMADTRTLGEALARGLRYYRLLLHDFVPRLQVRDGVATLALTGGDRSAPGPAFAERAFCFLAYGWTCWLVGRRVPLLAVDYPDSVLARSMDTSTLLQAPVVYGQPHTGWRFEARWLDLPVVQNQHSVLEFLRQAPASLLVRYRDQTRVTERIRSLFRKHLAGETPSLDEVGKRLAMTPQTLRRRLREEAQTFRGIKEELRRDAAIEYLARTEFTLPEIAARLGYSEASTFHRAFKQWTELAPGEYRQTRLR
ncbi:AraC family transcriptional regulator [Pseudorhodoferax sp.]|uniref:AraC family transcriptional regulator n=1 Tax=Pseudorhodoferax sp. TaxID=1993553 RepID=UPI002DD665B8|nr:AraC family transcriptional regulator [Pseudorhodoferax sp.]